MSEEAVTNDSNKRKWPKKRRTFISNAKKYAKKGQMGRGTKMSEELYQYFMGILDVMKQGIEDKEERCSLVNNVLDRTKGEELNVVGNQLGCRVIEILLPYSSPEDLERFIEVLSPELRRLCSDNFTSHVVETLLKVCCDRATAHLQSDTNDDAEVPKKKVKLETEVVSETKYTDEHIQNCYNFTIKISKYALNNLEDFVWDSYANHILRSALKCLSGITLLPGEKPKVNLFKEASKELKGIPPHLTKMDYKNVPDDFKEIVKEFAERLSSWPQFKDLPFQNTTSALLQVLLYAIKNVDKNLTRDLLKKLLNESFAPDDWVSTANDDKKDVKDDKTQIETSEVKELAAGDLPPVFSCESSVRLLEASLFVAKKKMYTQLYAQCFMGRLARLAGERALNFTVQRLLDNCQIKEEFEPMFDEVSVAISAALSRGNSGVLVALAKGCLRLQARQAHLITALESALGCSAPEQQRHLAACCLLLKPLSALETTVITERQHIHVHGSVILQTMLDYQRPAKVVSSLLSLTAAELVVVLSDAKGSHVADALCAGRCVGAKARERLIDILKGNYQQLAISRCGSRAFERLFAAAPAGRQLSLAGELAHKAGLLRASHAGRLLADNMHLDAFQRNQQQWMKLMKIDEAAIGK